MSLKTKQIYEFGAFRLNAAERLLFQNGEAVPLPPKVIETLLVLVENNGRLIEKEELMRRVWPDTFVEENNLNRHVSILRKVLGEGQGEQKFIETIPKRGYRFAADVTRHEDEIELVVERSKARIVIEEEREIGEPESQPEITQPPALKAPAEAVPAGEVITRTASYTRRFIALSLVAALAILTATGVWLLWRNPDRTSKNAPADGGVSAPPKTIAVLPFQPINAEGRDEVLELGMTDALITKLSSLEQVIVRPTSAVRKYDSLNQDPLAAGREQKVDAVLVGNVQKVGDALRVSVQLLKVEDGRSLWSEKFDVKFTDIFAVQDSISERVTNALALQLTGEDRARLVKRYTENDEAYQLYQKGRYFLESNTEENVRRALGYFRQATEKDPNYALAFAGITRSFIVLSTNVVGVSKEEVDQARAAAERAIALDENLGEAHHALADIEFSFEWNWDGARREFARAIELNPNDAGTRQSYSDYLLAAGKLEEGLAEARRAVELDPLSVPINLHLSLALLSLRKYDEAIAEVQKTAELNVPYAIVQGRLGRIYMLKGMYEEAIAHYHKALDAGGDRRVVLIGLAYCYALEGRRDEAQKMLDELLAQQNSRHTQYFYIATVQTALGQYDAAIASLEKGIAVHEEGMLFLRVEARFDPLRSDPRFIALMRRVGIPE